MSQQIALQITMDLLSDTIFGSGYSIPGGEDIAVCVDSKGYPYLKGTTLKGLLRESAEKIIAWEGGDPKQVELLFGTEGWGDVDEGKRLRFTSLTLCNPPTDPKDCFTSRTFTALDQGIIRKGSYRMAVCVRRGLRFEGEILCQEEDRILLQQALQGIQYLGTLRNRGFGHVRLSGDPMKVQNAQPDRVPCKCIYYRLYTKLPIQSTNLERSFDNSYETRPCISGAAVRGAVVNCLARKDPRWFEENRIELLSDRTRFLDALPACKYGTESKTATIPSPLGFYEDAIESGLESILRNGTYTGVKKRAKIGTFCSLQGDTIHYWKPETDSAMRIKRASTAEDKQVFQTQYLCAGQLFEGYIMLRDPELAPRIMDCLEGDIWIGADRYSGFGQCAAEAKSADQPAWAKDYGIQEQHEIDTTLYMLLLSPTAALDRAGCPVALDHAYLSEILGTETRIEHSATSVSEYRTYNRTWQCHSPAVRMYERGSMFKLRCQSAPTMDRLETLQKEGIGINRREGFGQILFLSRERFEALCKKQKLSADENSGPLPEHVILRRNKMAWIQEQSDKLSLKSLTKSRLGVVQAQCEKAIAEGGSAESLSTFLAKYTNHKNPATVDDYKGILALVNKVMSPEEVLPVKDPGDNCERLDLICKLLDYHRKGGKS